MKRNALLDYRDRDPRVSFWRATRSWPLDSLAYSFLARAVDQVGQALYGAQWTGQEPSTEIMPPLPQQLTVSVSIDDLRRGSSLLIRHHPRFAERNEAEAFDPLNHVMPTAEEWALAVEISEQQARDCWPAFGRFIRVVGWLSASFNAGEIRTGARNFEGGEVRPLEAHIWNTESIWTRFACCQLSAESPFSDQIVQTGGLWIFVENESLARSLRARRSNPATQVVARDGYLSPYLQTMIEVSRALRITPENQPKKQEVEAEIPKHWHDRARLMRSDVKWMATLIRDPASKAGRGRKRSPQP
jgi:hypothetical protein